MKIKNFTDTIPPLTVEFTGSVDNAEEMKAPDYDYGSITPKTVSRSKELKFTFKKIQTEENIAEPIIFSSGIHIHEYKCADNNVIHFSINTNDALDISQLKPIDTEDSKGTQPLTLKIFGIEQQAVMLSEQEEQFVSGSDKKEEKTNNKKGASVKGSNKSSRNQGTKTSDNTQSKQEKTKFHPIEKLLLEEAISYLLDNQENKTVLIDILERESKIIGKPIKIKGEKLATHAVLLYKNPIKDGRHEILVIDPSNFAFSSHLSDYNEELRTKYAKLDALITLSRPMQIYKQGNEGLGKEPNKYRDCIDIAVKLAFGFNKFASNIADSHQIIDLNKIKDHPIVQAISNQREIDATILVEESAVRIKQASDFNVIQAFYKIQGAIKRNAQKVLELRVDKYTEYNENIIKILSKDYHNADILKELLAIDQELVTENIEIYTEELNKVHSDLSNDISTLVGNTIHDT